MRVTYDISADAAYIYLREIGPGEAAATLPLDPIEAHGTINLDLDADGRLIGIEVLGASAALPRELLDRAEIIG